MRSDLKHLKWRLIHKEGLTVEEASKRIEKMIEWENKNNRLTE